MKDSKLASWEKQYISNRWQVDTNKQCIRWGSGKVARQLDIEDKEQFSLGRKSRLGKKTLG